MYAIYDNIYHQYTPNVSIYGIHGSYGILIYQLDVETNFSARDWYDWSLVGLSRMFSFFECLDAVASCVRFLNPLALNSLAI